MNTSMDKIISSLSKFLNQDTSGSVNNILNSLGISKEDALKKLNNITQEDITAAMNNKKIVEKLNQLSQNDIEKIKELSSNQDNIQELYKKYNDLKEGK